MQTELCIPSDLKFLPVIEAWLLGTLRTELEEWPGWPTWESRLRLVVVEAYSNVVRHAHCDQPHMPVVLKLTLQREVLCLEVWDRGLGFDLKTYLPPVPGRQQEGGYGWLILNRLMDKVEYQVNLPGGNNCLMLQANLPVDRLTPPLSPPPAHPHP
ncbi:MAG: anti-sigma regulatory factor [Cyanobacteria bacterium P01_D01_bin.71]